MTEKFSLRQSVKRFVPKREEKKPVTRMGIALDVTVLLGFLWFTWEALGFVPTARHFPLFVGIAGASIASATTLLDVLRFRRQPRRSLHEESGGLIGSGKHLIWFGCFLLAAFLFSLIPAAVAYLILYLRLSSHMRWWGIALVVGVVLAVLIAARFILGLDFPPGLFFTIF